MRSILIIATILFSSMSFARFPSITAKNLSLDMKGNSGVGFVNFLKYNINNIGLTHTALQAQVKRYPDRFIVSDTETQIEFNYPLIFMDNFSSIDLHDVNLVSLNELFNLEVPKATVDVKGMNYELDQINLNCQGTPGIKSAFDSCTEKSLFSVSKFLFSEKSKMSKFFSSIADAVTPSFVSGWNPFKVRFIHDLKLNVVKSKLTGEVKIKSIIDVPITLEGTIAYNEKNEEFKIELLKAKAWFIDIRKIIFKQLTGLNIAQLKVEPPFIYIKLSVRK